MSEMTSGLVELLLCPFCSGEKVVPSRHSNSFASEDVPGTVSGVDRQNEASGDSRQLPGQAFAVRMLDNVRPIVASRVGLIVRAYCSVPL